MFFLHLLISLAALASLAAVAKPFMPFSTRGRALLTFLGLCLLNGITALGSLAPSTRNGATAKNKNMSMAAPQSSEAPPVLEENPKNWTYSENTDEMTGIISHIACTTSTNELSFSFPYGGGSTGELCFRKKAKALNAWVKVSSGQFNCGIENCALKLKFDDGSVQSFSGGESATHETGFLFVESEQRLLAAVLKARKLKFQAQFYQEGNQVLAFNVSGLELGRL